MSWYWPTVTALVVVAIISSSLVVFDIVRERRRGQR